MRKRILVIWLCGFCLLVMPRGLVNAELSRKFPHFNFFLKQLVDYRPPLTTTVYAKDGSILAYFYRQNRFPVTLETLPNYVKQAFIAAEDGNFYTHDGVDPHAVFRAFSNNAKTAAWRQGGSTITQQVVKGLLLSKHKSYTRKFKEMVLAYHLEKYLAKEQILTIYLNEIYLGAGAYGLEAAARIYFNKHAHCLSLAEAALLAGLPKAPSQLNPYHAPTKAKTRQLYVLDRMLAEEFISSDQYQHALIAPLNYQRMYDPSWKLGPYYLAEVRRWLLKHLSFEKLNAQGIGLPYYGEDALYEGGLHIYTAFDHHHQQAAQKALTRGLEQLTLGWENILPLDQAPRPKVQGAIFSMDPQTGEVKALVGGYDYNRSQFNRATQAQRQPGSLFKPVVFSTALTQGYTAASMVRDSPFSLYLPLSQTSWKPKNFSGKYRGLTLLRTAMTQSINVVAARLAHQVGISKVIHQARQMGFKSDLLLVPSLSLGACEANLMELVQVYSTFPRGGTQIEPRLVLSVYDRDFKLIFHNTPLIAQAMSPQNAYIITDLLKQSVESGTGRRVKALNHPVAGKTGTSNNMRDAWFMGFTPYLLTGVFVGFDDGRSMGKMGTGAKAAAPIWLDYHKAIKNHYRMQEFKIPANILFGSVTPDGNYLGQGWYDKAIVLAFKKGTEPKRLKSKDTLPFISKKDFPPKP
jgi:1A family penicillin-binding protein